MPVPVISVAQMREWERATWAAGQTEAAVIRRVGQKVATCARELTRPGDAILVLAGKGHNGDDARAAGKFLGDRKVVLLNVTDPKSGLAKLQSRPGILPAQDRLEAYPTLIIDGLFGIGLDRQLDADWKNFIAAVNYLKIPVLAVDVPSGLNADTGGHSGAVVEAATTLTVGAPKIGLLAQTAWPFVGRLEVMEDVGLIPCPVHSGLQWSVPDDYRDFPPRRGVAGHKGMFGHLAIIAGSFGYHGAAVLAARAAQRARPGLVTLFTDPKVHGAVASQLQAVMVNLWKTRLKFPDSTTAILIGPGLAAPGIPSKKKSFAREFWRDSDLPVIVDASALDWLPAGKFSNGATRVVTPHPGEAARMLNTTAQVVQANRAAALRGISRRFGNCWVVLKGHQTLIGRGTGPIFVNPSGNPELGQGGSGDVLAGFIGGLLAQPGMRADAGKAIRYAVWEHGATADALQQQKSNWVVEDLVAAIGRQAGWVGRDDWRALANAGVE